jgi:hypothetical protein
MRRSFGMECLYQGPRILDLFYVAPCMDDTIDGHHDGIGSVCGNSETCGTTRRFDCSQIRFQCMLLMMLGCAGQCLLKVRTYHNYQTPTLHFTAGWSWMVIILSSVVIIIIVILCIYILVRTRKCGLFLFADFLMISCYTVEVPFARTSSSSSNKPVCAHSTVDRFASKRRGFSRTRTGLAW